MRDDNDLLIQTGLTGAVQIVPVSCKCHRHGRLDSLQPERKEGRQPAG